ncbi:MAG: hypothetical protein K2J04_13075, partial [Lachnospiraceae bacterium]|nr:hypothetical protein [Lachnospiraceae bacterium]
PSNAWTSLSPLPYIFFRLLVDKIAMFYSFLFSFFAILSFDSFHILSMVKKILTVLKDLRRCCRQKD